MSEGVVYIVRLKMMNNCDQNVEVKGEKESE